MQPERQNTFKDLTGKRFGRLVVIEEVEPHFTPGGQKVLMWKCKCDCGTEKIISGISLKSGATISCGCFHREQLGALRRKHGAAHQERLYGVWLNLRERCRNPNNNHYHSYGGRGINVCDDWMNDYSSFRDWALKNGYREDIRESGRNNITIDRIDVDGDYEPSNCRFVTNRENCLNKRDTMSDEERYQTCPICGKPFIQKKRNGQQTCSYSCGQVIRKRKIHLGRNPDGTFRSKLQTTLCKAKEAT